MAHIAGRPDIQAKAWAELDRVVGRDRLPNEHDEKKLPYIRAIAKLSVCLDYETSNTDLNAGEQEVARTHNPFWLGTPHFSTEDFTYNGYFIPKETVIIANTVSDTIRCSCPLKF